MIAIVLDTTELVSDPTLRGGALRLLLEASRRNKCRLYVPEVVMAEAIAHQERELAKLITKLESLRKDYRRQTGRDLPLDDAMVDVQTQSNSYSYWFRAQFERGNAEFVPYATVSHEELVEAAVGRRAPFSESGAGYRDALVWEAVKEVVADTPYTVALVTKNIRDFAADSDSLRFAEELLEQVDHEQVERLELVSDLKGLVSARLQPDLDAHAEVSRRFEREEDFRERFLSSLESCIQESDDYEYIQAGYPVTLIDINAQVGLKRAGVEIIDATVLNEDVVILTVDVRLDVVFSATVRPEDYYEAGESERPDLHEIVDGHELYVGDNFSVLLPIEAFMIRESGEVDSIVL